MSLRRLLELLFFCVAGLFLCGVLWTGFNYMTSAQNYTAQGNTPAHEKLLQDAYDGDAAAQFRVGGYYHQGAPHFPQSLEMALEWYQKAADQGHAQAQFISGYFYQTGQGTEKNLEKAVPYYTLLNEAGDLKASVNLAMAYEEMVNMPDHLRKAAVIYKHAAELGDAYSQYKTGLMYFEGTGFLQDDAKAFEWFEKSYQKDRKYAGAMLGSMYLSGRAVSKDIMKAAAYYQEDALKNDTVALRFIEKSAAYCQNIFKYQFRLDFLEACLFAAEAGHAETQFTLATIIENGSMGELPHKEAEEYYRMAAAQGHNAAQEALKQDLPASQRRLSP